MGICICICIHARLRLWIHFLLYVNKILFRKGRGRGEGAHFFSSAVRTSCFGTSYRRTRGWVSCIHAAPNVTTDMEVVAGET